MIVAAKSKELVIIQDPPESGEWNMRQDALVLAREWGPTSTPILRFFEWLEPTVTFGRLQKEEDVRNIFAADPVFVKRFQNKNIPLVSRPTGGGAVLHDGDLSFSLFWPRGSAFMPLPLGDMYRAIHAKVRRALDRAGVASTFCVAAKSGGETTGLCFQEPVESDLLTRQGDKILGGALRVTSRACLYQGNLKADGLLPARSNSFWRDLLAKEFLS